MHSRKCLCSIEKLDIFRRPLTFATVPVKIILQRIISVVWWTNFLSEIWGLPIHDDDCQSLSLSMKRGELDSDISAQPLMIAYASWTKGRWEWLTLSGAISIYFCGPCDKEVCSCSNCPAPRGHLLLELLNSTSTCITLDRSASSKPLVEQI